MEHTLLRRLSEPLIVSVETIGAAVILAGVAWAAVQILTRGLSRRDASVFTAIRLSLGRFLALGLEFQLAGDILRTAFNPTLTEIGQLAAIAAIRTALNFVLRREIAQEQRQLDPPRSARDEPAART